MKRRMMALIAVAALLMSAIGCAGSTTDEDVTVAGTPPQLVLAMNPVFVYDDGETITPYHDISNAIEMDFTSSSMTTMAQTTTFRWMSKSSDGWNSRSVCRLMPWVNGAGQQARSVYAYTYNDAGLTSLANYATRSTALTAYGKTDTVPECGLLLSAAVGEEEALTYTIGKDGRLSVKAGVYTAVRSVDGVETGFLVEDGTPRRADVRILLNDTEIVSGTLCNATAAEGGVAVTTLTHGQLSDMVVKEGDTLRIAVRLDAAANCMEEPLALSPSQESHWVTADDQGKALVRDDETVGDADTNLMEGESLSFTDDEGFRFFVVRNISAMSMEENQLAGAFREELERTFEAEVIARNEQHDVKPYEIVLGLMENRPESVKIHKELKYYRVNNANDYIVRRVGNKVYISALNTDSLTAAIQHFVDTFCSGENKTIPPDYDYVYRAPTLAMTIGGSTVGNYLIRVEKYATTMAWRGAQELQQWVLNQEGYRLPIIPHADNGKRYEHEVVVGPLNGSVQLERAYDTRFTADTIDTIGKFKMDDDGYDGAPYAYAAKVSGKKLLITGGSSYAVNAAVQQVRLAWQSDKDAVHKDFSISGVYKVGNYALTGGYDLAWKEDFSYSGTSAEMEQEVREYWSVSTDSANGPTQLGVDGRGNIIWDQQRRPGLYGENWWIWKDGTDNGYLVQITKKESYGYDAGRLISKDKWSFRYGIWDTRLIIGSRNGACSAVWTETDQPDSYVWRNEFDLFENFGEDCIYSYYHTWGPDKYHERHSPDGLYKEIAPPEGEHFYDTFHSLSIEWTAESLTYYWDGEPMGYYHLTDEFSGQSSTTIKFACGVGTAQYATYRNGANPYEWMDEAYTALTGKTVEDFFEVQMVDYSYLFQTSNEGKSELNKSYIKFDCTHPSSEFYFGYLSNVDGYQSRQTP